MPKNIILLSDGTGNSAASSTKTNVWRLYEALDLTGCDQVASFDDGVGTSSFAPLRYLGLVLGIGVKRNVLDLYTYLCRVYEPGDQIYVFGFSRGAFTVRLLCGLISRQGLVPYESEEQLLADARAVFGEYQRIAFETPLLLKPWRCLTGRSDPAGSAGAGDAAPPVEQEGRRYPAIAFLGVWDTVAAYGLPIQELTTAVNKLIWPLDFADTFLPAKVSVARQALSLDDERRTFFPIPWTEPAGSRPVGTDASVGRLLQVWFAGAHADVGGGYADDRLSYVPLLWMMHEAARHGLRFDAERMSAYAAVASFEGTRHDSRAGLQIFYRYRPRSIAWLMKLTAKPTPPRPLLHHSVVWRMAYGTDRYAPLSVDADVDVLAENGTVVALRPAPAGAGPLPAVQEPINLLCAQAPPGGHPMTDRHEAAARMHDMIWWRRALYFVLLFGVLGFAALPWVGPCVPVPATLNTDLADVVAPLVALARPFVPSMAAPWLEALTHHPAASIAVLAPVLFAWRVSAKLDIRIRDWARAAWSQVRRKQVEARDVQRKQRQVRRWITSAAVLSGMGLALLIASWLVPNADIADGLAGAAWPVSTVGLVTVLLAVALWRQDKQRDGAQPAEWWTLTFARMVRRCGPLVRIYDCLVKCMLPTLCVLGVVLAFAAGLANIVWYQGVFQAKLLTGMLCSESTAAREVATDGAWIEARERFSTSNVCWASGLRVTKGRRYEVEMTIPSGEPDWFDRTVHTGLRGFPADGFVHHASLPLKRWMAENWFAPIARIGRSGITEEPLRPITAPKPVEALDAVSQARFEALMKLGSEERTLSQPIDNQRAREATALFQGPHAPERTIRAVIMARKSGELFLFVNDAVPNAIANTYANNLGVADVRVRDTSDIWPCVAAGDARRAGTTCQAEDATRK